MGTTTKNLGLYKPAANDYYNVETDQNENFDKIDEKFGEVDNGLNKKLNKGTYEGDADDLKREIDGKEPAFEKNSGFNKEKTDDYNGNDTNKLFTQKGANDLYKEVEEDIRNIDLSGKVDKTGDTMNGSLVISTSYQPTIGFNLNGVNKGGIYGDDNALIVYNAIASTFLHMYDNGDTTLRAKNLKTISKEVVAAINELNDTKASLSGCTYTGSVTFKRPIFIDADNNNIKLLSRGINIGELVSQKECIMLWNSTSGKAIKVYNNGTIELPSNNLNTEAKECVGSINELHSRFVNPTLLYTNNGSRQDNFAVPNFSKYRVLLIKYQVGFSVDSAQIGGDIMNVVLYMEDENPNFHLVCDGRTRFYVTGDNLKMTFNDIGEDFCIRKIYGLIKK